MLTIPIRGYTYLCYIGRVSLTHVYESKNKISSSGWFSVENCVEWKMHKHFSLINCDSEEMAVYCGIWHLDGGKHVILNKFIYKFKVQIELMSFKMGDFNQPNLTL